MAPRDPYRSGARGREHTRLAKAAQPWFEISNAGWRARAHARPLGRLLLEAVQNAFDECAKLVTVQIRPEGIVVEDDAAEGFTDERLVYTVFLSDKPDTPTRRGRLGRGLKELIASMDRAEVRTVGSTIVFDEEGRHTSSNRRKRGTRLVLQRPFEDAELKEAVSTLKACIPPRGVTLRVDGSRVRRPSRILALGSVELESVVIDAGIERRVLAATTVSVYAPRRNEEPTVYEMGIPVQKWDVPWHVDVGQRVPVSEGRDQLPDDFRLCLKGTLLEAMIHNYMEPRDLRAEWVHDAVANWPVRTGVLDAYVSRVFPRGAVLQGSKAATDRAAQLGAHIIEASSMPRGTFAALGRVLETADEYTRRRDREFGGDPVEPDEVQKCFAASVIWLARELTGQRLTVGFFASDPAESGLMEDAVTDVANRHVRFNVRAGLRFDDLLEPRTFGVVLHELAHQGTPLHDRRFIDRLQELAGAAARLLAEGGPALADALRRGHPTR